MDRSKLKRGTLILTTGTLAAIPGCYQGPFGKVSEPCCDDAGHDPSGGTDCRTTCYGISVNPSDGGDSGEVGFFVVDASDGGTPDGGKNGE